MASIPEIGGFAEELASILGINNWQLNECSYNGAQFHWMQPSFNGLNPAASITSYIENALTGSASQKPNYGTWSNVFSCQDTLTTKLAMSPIANMNGTYVEEFGVSGAMIEMVGLVYGPSYMTVLDTCTRSFFDTQVANSNPPIGVTTGVNFRQLNHIIYGLVTQVYRVGYSIITSSDKFQAAAFKLTLLASDPSYITTPTNTSSWASEIQNILNGAEGGAADINQAFSMGQSLPGSLLGAPSVNIEQGVVTPVRNGTGKYLQSILKEINNRLVEVGSVFDNCMAFLAQNSGGFSNSYWNSIIVDYTKLPIYLSSGQIFQYSDAQIIISYFTSVINTFIKYSKDHGYDYNLQNNIFSMSKSVTYLNEYSKLVLSKNNTLSSYVTVSNDNLYNILFNNKVQLSNFDAIIKRNEGAWYSCLSIPPGLEMSI